MQFRLLEWPLPEPIAGELAEGTDVAWRASRPQHLKSGRGVTQGGRERLVGEMDRGRLARVVEGLYGVGRMNLETVGDADAIRGAHCVGEVTSRSGSRFWSRSRREGGP